MHVFVMACYDSSNNSILFIQSVFKSEQEAKRFCDLLNKDDENQRIGIYFDYTEQILF